MSKRKTSFWRRRFRRWNLQTDQTPVVARLNVYRARGLTEPKHRKGGE